MNIECNVSHYYSMVNPSSVNMKVPLDLPKLWMKRWLLMLRHSRATMNEIVNTYAARHVEPIAKAPTTMSAITVTSFLPNPNGPILMVPQRMSKVTTPEDWRCGIDSVQNKLAQHLENQTPASIAAIAYAEATGASAADLGAAIGTVLQPYTKLHGWINLIATNIYRKVGCTELWKEVTVVCLAIKEVVDLLEDLLCSAISGTDKLCSAFREDKMLSCLGEDVRGILWCCVETPLEQLELICMERIGDSRMWIYEGEFLKLSVTLNLSLLFAHTMSHIMPEEDANWWGLPPQPTCIPKILIDARMEKTLREHLDIYIRAIKQEESTNFWMWFLDMWVRVHPEMVTNPWEHEFKASVFACYKCLEQWLNWNGGQAAKDDIAASYCWTPSPKTDDSSSETGSSSGDSEASSQSDAWSKSLSHASSDLGWADDGHRTEATGAKNTSKGKKVKAMGYNEVEAEIIADAVFDEDNLDGGPETPSPVCMQHTDFNVNSGSHLQSTTSYHDAPPSPVKPKSTLHDPILDGPTLDEENNNSDSEYENDPHTAMDPQASTEDADIQQASWLSALMTPICETGCRRSGISWRSFFGMNQQTSLLLNEWTGTFFKHTTLGELGMVIDLDGIQTVYVDYCNCTQSLGQWHQLLHSHLFPSTVVDPQMATTFWTLEVFHLLSFMLKVSGYKFYHMLVCLTDNTGTCQPPNRFQAFMRVVCEWRHLKLLKWKLDKSPRDFKDTPPGELSIPVGSLAVECPACPWPGINLDEGWETDPQDPVFYNKLMISLRWKYMLYVAIDANFQLVHFVVSNASQDPSLINGAGFVVAQEEFRRHVAEYGKCIPFDPSDCCDHQAVKLTTSKHGVGLATSSVATVDCAHHDSKGPVAVTILDHGEEQVQMDYIFLSRMQQSAPPCVVVSYDINCQWFKKLWECITIYPTSMKPPQDPGNFVYLIPKFHIPAHILSCYIKYSFYKTPYVRETDGEAPKRSWNRLNQLAPSLKVMGLGAYLDTLNDHIGDYNYRKFDALERDQGSNSCLIFLWRSVCLTLAEEEAAELSKIIAHEAEQGETAVEGGLEVMVDIEMVQANPQQDRDDDIFLVRHEVGPSSMILQGVELESDQRRLKLAHAALGPHSMDRECAKVTEGLNWLQRRLNVWFEIQQVYMPCITALWAEWNRAQLIAKAEAEAAQAAADEAATTKSGKKKGRRSMISHFCQNKKLMDFEFWLCEAESYECLMMLRRQLIFRSHIYKFKDQNVTSQLMSTRVRSTISSVMKNIDEAATRYRKLWADLVVLAVALGNAKAGWDQQLWVLNAADVRPLDETMLGETEDAEETAEALRIEWCKTHACAHCWHKEVILVEEEMTRVKAFFACEARTWMSQVERGDISIDPEDGDKPSGSEWTEIEHTREGEQIQREGWK
ncbi:hypothetical protein EV421DRAFT_1740461 [Armillaria borealis]|uniref:CxC2-like cysteine cluster KDZ transposase-associated domain-containing protein n=1 Tax=Armillaria borealis TaxID=47425 RepID=A0AA39J650_9AGAR|nr:hypothetical protein EV421DRAFT_1740461 [Armillaria borealis]